MKICLNSPMYATPVNERNFKVLFPETCEADIDAHMVIIKHSGGAATISRVMLDERICTGEISLFNE